MKMKTIVHTLIGVNSTGEATDGTNETKVSFFSGNILPQIQLLLETTAYNSSQQFSALK